MSKVIILGDLHLGARNASSHFSDYFNSFFRDQLYPYCSRNGITDIIQLGDLFDSRTNISLKAFHRSKSVWFDELRARGLTMYTLLGNHDIHYRESLLINSPELFLGEYSDCVKIISTPTQIKIDSMTIDLLPWICKENLQEVSDFIQRSDRGSIVCGHFEFSGFKMQANSPEVGSIDVEAQLFSQLYSKVLSGHYHTRSQSKNILYTGIPYEITWSDFNDPKGFHVLDTHTGELEFITNPDSMFFRAVLSKDQRPSDFIHLSGKIVRGFYDSSVFSDKEVETFCTRLRLINPYNLTLHDTAQTGLAPDGDVSDRILSLDTKQFISSFITEHFTHDADMLTNIQAIMDEAYAEALTIIPTLE